MLGQENPGHLCTRQSLPIRFRLAVKMGVRRTVIRAEGRPFEKNLLKPKSSKYFLLNLAHTHYDLANPNEMIKNIYTRRTP